MMTPVNPRQSPISAHRVAQYHSLEALLMMILLLLTATPLCRAEEDSPEQIAPGVWFLLGDDGKGYSNTVVIEMRDYLIVVDANFPGRALELQTVIKRLSPKTVRYVFDTHAHGDHSYGNSVWTKYGATTLAYKGVVDDMNRTEPRRWQFTASKRDDVRATGESDVERPRQTFTKSPFVLSDGAREVEFLFLGWGHTQGDGYVWLPKEKILCTGDAAVNGPYNYLIDGYIANWPVVLTRAIELHPRYVLPGHGKAGGIEILIGQRSYLRDLYKAVDDQAKRGVKPAEMNISLPPGDDNWFPPSAPGLSQLLRHVAIEKTYQEITEHKPAGSVPMDWGADPFAHH